MITLASSSWTDRKDLEVLCRAQTPPCVYLQSPDVTAHDKISQALPLWVSKIHFNHHGGPGKLVQACLRIGKVLKCHFNWSNTPTVELTKRAKTVFFTSQAHIYKTIGDTKNISTFS